MLWVVDTQFVANFKSRKKPLQIVEDFALMDLCFAFIIRGHEVQGENREGNKCF